MKSRIRRAALIALAATFAAPAFAQAHHVPTCPGFQDPQCNVNYFYAHQAQPHVETVQGLAQPVVDEAEYQVWWAGAFVACMQETRCRNAFINGYWDAVRDAMEPALVPVEQARDEALRVFALVWAEVGDTYDEVDQVTSDALCEYFGACG